MSADAKILFYVYPKKIFYVKKSYFSFQLKVLYILKTHFDCVSSQVYNLDDMEREQHFYSH